MHTLHTLNGLPVAMHSVVVWTLTPLAFQTFPDLEVMAREARELALIPVFWGTYI